MANAHSWSGCIGRLALAVAAFALLAAAACGGGDDSKATSSPATSTAPASATVSPSPVADQGPLEALHSGLDALNRGDVDGAFAYLSKEARQQVSLATARTVINGLRTSGLDLSVTIDKVRAQAVTGDTAEIELSLIVKIGENSVPLDDSASLVREDGQWRISDHFLQTALAAVGLAKPLTAGPRELDADGCAKGDPMNGVYAAARLKILDSCITVVGTVRDDIEHAQDGDITFGLYLSGDDLRLLNEVNKSNYDGALHIEIVPLDQERLKEPKPGDRIRVTGPWVTDTVHGHNEIHPAFVIEPAP